jgi:ATP-dependent RNA helicase HelY
VEAGARTRRARRKTARATDPPGAVPSPVRDFETTYGFEFDDFQLRACAALEDGSSVLVAAPTGAGKTVVGEFAAWLALESGGKTFYTTPIKALSNQKYGDFQLLHGAPNVGLLTGDNSINGDAQVVVMTTEVLRNMIYEDSDALDSLQYVVLDEVHYLQDPYRGAVWEEVLIHLPVDVQIVSLSATVSNAEEFAEWLQTLRGRTEVIIEEKRPVEVRHWYFAADELLPMFVQRPDGDVVPNPRGRESDRRRRRGAERPGRGGRRVHGRRARIPYRSDVVERLNAEGMLPAIYFIFSRKGCDDAVRFCLMDHVRLTTAAERARIIEYAESRVTDLAPDELDVLGFDDWMAGLASGIAAHHAGLIPPFKETVEELFKKGLVKAVFATETLALGINMPARTVVIENLIKFTGERHELMTPGEYTQLTGRAGRRGIDELGHSVVLLQRLTPFDTITRLASTRTYPLNSSFQVSYNMAVNLVRTYDRHDAEHLVNSSFAQFQADRDVVQLERTRERSEAYLASYRERMHCERGDFDEYGALVDKLHRIEERAEAARAGAGRVTAAIDRLHPGDVIEIGRGRRRGRYAVLEVGRRRSERAPHVLAVSEDRSLTRFARADFKEPPVAIGHLGLPKEFKARDPQWRKDLSRRLRDVQPDPPSDSGSAGESKEESALRRRVETHPCHDCPDRERHMHFAHRAARLEREIARLERRINRRTGTLARRFETVLSILEDLGYVKGWELTAKGGLLTSIYNESDLLVAETIERGLVDGLDPVELATVLSAMVYETRGPEGPPAPSLPTKTTAAAYERVVTLWEEIHAAEEERGVELTREPDPGFTEHVYRWAAGTPLEHVIDEDDAPGDFVRSIKQLVDLLRQIEEIAPDPDLRANVRTAVNSLHRGVVAYSSLEV